MYLLYVGAAARNTPWAVNTCGNFLRTIWQVISSDINAYIFHDSCSLVSCNDVEHAQTALTLQLGLIQEFLKLHQQVLHHDCSVYCIEVRMKILWTQNRYVRPAISLINIDYHFYSCGRQVCLSMGYKKPDGYLTNLSCGRDMGQQVSMVNRGSTC